MNNKNKKLKMPVLRETIAKTNEEFKNKYINNSNVKKINMPFIDKKNITINEKINNKCSPSIGFIQGSCVPLSILQKIAELYNKNSNNKIQIIENETINENYVNDYKLYLVNELQNVLGIEQTKWKDYDFMEDLEPEIYKVLENDIFRIEGPDKQYTWMDSVRITLVMKQYDDLYSKFKFLGAVPLDFEKIPYYKIKDIDFDELKENEGKTKFGLIINSDKHTGSGQHWFMMYFDLEKGEIYFIDSCAQPPERYGQEIEDFVDTIKKYLISKNFDENDIVFKYNTIEHQKENSECGVYSMYYIEKFLEGKTFDEITKNIIRDDKVNEYRLKFFSNIPKNWKKNNK